MKLLIIDDYPMERKGIKVMLECSEEFFEIFESGNISDAASILRKENPDLVLLDLNLGKENGLDILAIGKGVSKNCKYIILADFISEIEFLRAEEYGVDGYIFKDACDEDIIYAIRSVVKGKKYYDSGLISYRKNNETIKLFNQLTEREKEVLIEIGKGLSNEEIAHKLYISKNTVKKHVSSILGKLNLNHRSQIVHFIYSTNIVREYNE